MGVVNLRVVANHDPGLRRVLGEQSREKGLKRLRGEVRRLLDHGRPAADIHGAEEGHARMMAIGGDLLLLAAPEPSGTDRLIRADVARVLKEDYGVRGGVFFSAARRSANAACSAGRARFNT